MEWTKGEFHAMPDFDSSWQVWFHEDPRIL